MICVLHNHDHFLARWTSARNSEPFAVYVLPDEKSKRLIVEVFEAMRAFHKRNSNTLGVPWLLPVTLFSRPRFCFLVENEARKVAR